MMNTFFFSQKLYKTNFRKINYKDIIFKYKFEYNILQNSM